MKNFRKVLAALLAVVIAVCAIPVAAVSAEQSLASTLVDFPMGWSHAAMTEAVENGIIHGYEDNTVRPKGLLTRAEMAAIVTRAFGAEVSADIAGRFADVNPGDWFYDVIAKAVQMRVCEGGDGLMRPNEPITREDALVILARALVIEAENEAALTAFSDSVNISPYARGHVAAFLGRGYVHGYEDGTFLPKNNITREEFAQMMANIFSAYVRDNGAITLGDVEGEVILTGDDVYFYNTVVHGDLIIGDGVGATNVTVENVTIEGRIVFRGGEGRVLFANTKKGELVVVNDYNGTVNFHHYSTEAFFTDGVYNTPATFLDRTVAGGTASGTGLLTSHDTQTVGRVDAGTGSSEKPDDGGITQPTVPSKPGTGDTTKYYNVNFREFGNQIVHTVEGVRGAGTVSASDIQAAADKLYEKQMQGYVANANNIIAGYDKNVDHKISGTWYYIDNGEYKVFDENVVVNSDLDVFYFFNFAKLAISLEDILNAEAFANIMLEAPFDAESTSPVTHLDALYINETTIVATINAAISELKKQNIDIDGNGKDNYIPVSAQGDINNIIYTYRLINLLSEDTVRDYTQDAVVDFVLTDKTTISNAMIRGLKYYSESNISDDAMNAFDAYVTTYAKAALTDAIEGYIYWKNLTGESAATWVEDKAKRFVVYKELYNCTDIYGDGSVNVAREFTNAVADTVIANNSVVTGDDYKVYFDELVSIAKEVYLPLIEEFIDSLHNDETYKINKSTDITDNRAFIINAISKKLANTTVDEILVKLPAFVKEFFDADVLERIITNTIDAYELQVNEVKDIINAANYNGDIYYVDTCVDVVINPIKDVLIPAYENNKLALMESEYYTSNPYLDDIEKLLDYKVIFAESATSESGYAVRTGEETYDNLYSIAVLSYDASEWFVNNLDEAKLDAVITMASTDLFGSYTRFVSLMPFEKVSGDLKLGDSIASVITNFVTKNNVETFNALTYDRLITDRTIGYNELIACIKNESGFDLSETVTVTVSHDGDEITVKQGSNTVVIGVEDNGFIDFADIITSVTDKIGTEFDMIFEVDETELAKINKLSAYKLYINDDYVSFEVVLK